ncbi:MAG TPA: hypothetical protein VMW36_01950 [Patescibacteria group bacterium]|nr:hypothetical protein [Patescibacteria group bacterium]
MKILALLLLLVLPLAGLVVVSYGASEADARAAVGEASQRVNSCYSAGADAAEAGANVTGLLVTLDEAGGLLSRAELALAKGEFDSAATLAHLCEERLVGFEDGAISLRDTGSRLRTLDFAFGVVGSAVGSVAVVLVGVIVWFYLKHRSAGRVV